MNILPSQDQQEILSVIQSFLTSELPISRYREQTVEEAVYDDAIWQQLVELGWFGIAVPAKLGGSDLTFAEEMLIYFEAGKQLVSPSVLATSMAVKLALIIGDEALLKSLVTGQSRVAMGNALSLELDGSHVSGELQVFDGSGTDYFLVSTNDQLLLIERAQASNFEDLLALDSSSTLSQVSLERIEARSVALTAERLGEQFQVLLATQLAGMANAAMDMSVEYSKEREQYGQAIGSFQALQHMCADMAVLSEASHYLSVMAALAIKEQRSDAAQQVAASVMMARKAAENNSRKNIQIHGGMGFTEECNAQHYLKRKFVYEQVLDKLADPEKVLLDV